MSEIAVVAGTRPEIIKLAPVIRRLELSTRLEPFVVLSGQHDELAQQALRDFEISVNLDCALMEKDQTPSGFLARLLPVLQTVFSERKLSAVIVQGDTITALGAALSAFFLKIPVIHVEAGLRTHNRYSPFPEEMSRALISKLASWHFCPTESARKNLAQEGIVENVEVSGNTVVDALIWMDQQLEQGRAEVSDPVESLALRPEQYVLITCHRRENFDQPLSNFCQALVRLSERFPEIDFVYPLHLNPNVYQPVSKALGRNPRIHLLQPVNYPSFVYLMKHCRLIITDSGGIQEEAPTFQKPVLVIRESTERPEVLENCGAELVLLHDSQELVDRASALLSADFRHSSEFINPFGSGDSAEKIVSALEEVFC